MSVIVVPVFFTVFRELVLERAADRKDGEKR
jgi:hypothetical protein